MIKNRNNEKRNPSQPGEKPYPNTKPANIKTEHIITIIHHLPPEGTHHHLPDQSNNFQTPRPATPNTPNLRFSPLPFCIR
jgi:hypothetical protein